MFCGRHQQQYTNFCNQLQCLKFLCPDCIEEHDLYHESLGNQSQVDSIKNIKAEQLNNIQAALQNLNFLEQQSQQQQQGAQQQQQGEQSEFYNVNDLNQLNQAENKLIKEINSYFNQLKKQLQQQQPNKQNNYSAQTALSQKIKKYQEMSFDLFQIQGKLNNEQYNQTSFQKLFQKVQKIDFKKIKQFCEQELQNLGASPQSQQQEQFSQQNAFQQLKINPNLIQPIIQLLPKYCSLNQEEEKKDNNYDNEEFGEVSVQNQSQGLNFYYSYNEKGDNAEYYQPQKITFLEKQLDNNFKNIISPENQVDNEEYNNEPENEEYNSEPEINEDEQNNYNQNKEQFSNDEESKEEFNNKESFHSDNDIDEDEDGNNNQAYQKYNNPYQEDFNQNDDNEEVGFQEQELVQPNHLLNIECEDYFLKSNIQRQFLHYFLPNNDLILYNLAQIGQKKFQRIRITQGPESQKIQQSICVPNGEIYVFTSQSIFQFILEKKKFNLICPMQGIRQNFSLGYIDGYIYIIGGCQKQQFAERLNLKAFQNESTTEIAGSLKYNQQGIAVCCGWGHVFAVGCHAIEFCKINEHIWQEFLLQDEPLWGQFPGCVCINEEQLLVFGGEGFDSCAIVSKEKANTYEEENLPIKGAFPNNCCIVQGHIYTMKYVMQGTQEKNYLFVYDREEGGWTVTE